MGSMPAKLDTGQNEAPHIPRNRWKDGYPREKKLQWLLIFY